MEIEQIANIPVEFYLADLDNRSDKPEDNTEKTHFYRAIEIFDQSQLEQIIRLIDSDEPPISIRISDRRVNDDLSIEISYRDLDVYIIPKSGKIKRVYHQEWHGWGKCGSQDYDPCQGLKHLVFQS